MPLPGKDKLKIVDLNQRRGTKLWTIERQNIKEYKEDMVFKRLCEERHFECEDNVKREKKDCLCQTIRDCFVYTNYDTLIIVTRYNRRLYQDKSGDSSSA